MGNLNEWKPTFHGDIGLYRHVRVYQKQFHWNKEVNSETRNYLKGFQTFLFFEKHDYKYLLKLTNKKSMEVY